MQKPKEEPKEERWLLFKLRFKDKWLTVLFFCVIPPICLLLSPLLQILDTAAFSVGEFLINPFGLFGAGTYSIDTTKIYFPTLALSIMFGYNLVYTASMAAAPYVNGTPVHRYFPSSGRLLIQQVCICLAFVCEVLSLRALGCALIIVFLSWSICSILLFIYSNTADKHVEMENKLSNKPS